MASLFRSLIACCFGEKEKDVSTKCLLNQISRLLNLFVFFLDFALASMLVVVQTLPGPNDTTALLGSDHPGVDYEVPDNNS